MKKYILLIVAVFAFINANADNWQPMGEGYYQDPYWNFSNGQPVVGNVEVEQDSGKPGVYRFRAPLNSTPYIYVHCENPDKVYVSNYVNSTKSSSDVTLSHRCNENGWVEENYVKLINQHEVIIPGKYFSIQNGTSAWSKCSSGRDFIFRIPGQPSGVYFGIIAFNHLPKIKPMQLLDERNKNDFFSFVNQQKMDDYTYLYYSVEQGINELENYRYPEDLTNVTLITFTDGNDDGSLEMAPDTSWDDVEYQNHIKNLIVNTDIQGNKINAFSIGLKGKDIGEYNYDLFKSNLLSLASDDNATEVTNMSEVERTLNEIIDKLQTSWLTKKVQIRINMRASGDRIRFTLDKSREEMNNNPEFSDLWIEGTFSREDNSLNDIIYNGLKSSSGNKILAEKVTVEGKTKYQFTFVDLRDKDDNPLNTGEINYWHCTAANPNIWQPHTEFGGGGDVNVENEYTSAAIMFVMDCSSSLGNDDFSTLKNVVNSFIERLATKTAISDRVEKINIEDDPNAPEEYYNLQGIRINKPSRGIYIYRKGKTVKKVCL